MKSLRNSMAVFKRELRAYFESPVAYVFMVVFLVLVGFLTFGMAKFYERRIADLQPFFSLHPWVFLLLVPAATMGLWAEERRNGTIELLLTMPITLLEAVIGKFLAAWTFMIIGIILTFPIVLTTAYLGHPDFGVIFCGYFGSILLAGACVSICMFTSALTQSQVISFVLGLMICFGLLLAGWPPVTDLFVKWAPSWVVDAVAAFSFMPHFESVQRGVLDVRDLAYYLSIIVFMTATTHVVLENRKSA